MDKLTIAEYIKKAFEYKESGNYKQAIEFLYKALAIDNESSEVLNEIAGLYFKISNPERAIEYYEQALNLDPLNLSTKYNLAMVYKSMGNMRTAIDLLKSIYSQNKKLNYLLEISNILYIEKRYQEIIDFYNKSDYKDYTSDALGYIVGLAYIALGDNTKAEDIFRYYVSNNPSNNDIKYQLAKILYNKGIYDEAEQLLLSIGESKISAKVYFILGEINFAKNNIDQAINHLSIAVNIDPKNPLYFYELGLVYSLKGFLDEAEIYYQKAININPNDLTYNYTLAYLYYTKNEIAKANNKISYILSINPMHSDTLVLKALIASKEGDINKALGIIEDVIANVKTNDFAFYAKGLLYKELSWWDKAIETMFKAVELKPNSLEYLSELAFYYYEAKYYGETEEICKKILKIDDKYLFAHIMSAKVLIKNKNCDKAIKILELAIQFDNNSHEAYFLKAEIYKKQNQPEKAIEMAKTAITIAADNVLYYEFIAKCYYELKEYRDAFFYYKEASEIDILNVNYKYFMAKCSEFIGDVDNAISNFSVAKRIEPSDIFLSIEYSDFLCSQKQYKKAIDVLKSTMHNNPAAIQDEFFMSKLSEVENLIIENSNNIHKWFIKKK